MSVEHDCTTCLWEYSCDWIQDDECNYIEER